MPDAKWTQPAPHLPGQPLLNPLGQVVRWPSSPEERSLVVAYLARKFQAGQRYPEPHLDQMLGLWHTFADPALLRRALVEGGFLARDGEGSSYVRTALGVSDIPHRLKLENIQQAAQIIDPVFLRSPQFPAEGLSEVLGVELVVKVETLNPIRSFKGRGADYFVQQLLAQGDAPPRLVCASAGNFGQAMAYACRKHGLALTVFAAVNASPLKVARMRALGAEVRLVGEDFDAAKLEAKRFCQETGAFMVEDGKKPAISEGAGSVAVELLQHPRPLEAVVVPLGNGALLGGVARWVKAQAPEVRVVGVGAAGAPAMAQSWRSGSIVTHPRIHTIADGIGVRIPIPEALQDMAGLVDEVLLVTDEAMLEAMRQAHAHLGLVLEPSGAAGLAALLAYPQFKGQRVATVLCGGNLTEEQIKAWL